MPYLARAEKFIFSLNKERYKSFQEYLEKVELKQTAHITQGNRDRLPATLVNALLVSQLQELATAKEFKKYPRRRGVVKNISMIKPIGRR